MGEIVSGIIGANAQKSAARTAANAQMESARIAAEESRWRPVGLTNRFGSSQFTRDAEGRVSGASYDVSPDIAALRDQLLGVANQQNIGGVFGNIGAGATQLAGQMANAGDIGALANRFMTQQQALLAPGREQTLANLRNSVFQTGRSGLAVGATNAGNLAATNPEMQAYFNALAQEDARLAANADQYARQARADDMSALSGLFGLQQGSTQPLLGLLQGAEGIDALGRQNLTLGADLGRFQSNATGANALFKGGQNAAESNLVAANIRNNALQNVFGNQDLWKSVTSWVNNRNSSTTPSSTGSWMGQMGWDI